MTSGVDHCPNHLQRSEQHPTHRQDGQAPHSAFGSGIKINDATHIPGRYEKV